MIDELLFVNRFSVLILTSQERGKCTPACFYGEDPKPLKNHFPFSIRHFSFFICLGHDDRNSQCRQVIYQLRRSLADCSAEPVCYRVVVLMTSNTGSFGRRGLGK